MEKEEKVVVILLVMVFLSLSIAYVSFFNNGGISDVDEFSAMSVTGERVFVQGDIVSKRFTSTGNHLLMTVNSDSGPVKVFIPSANGAKDIGSMVNKDDVVRVTGNLEDYQGEPEIVVQHKGDVVLIRAA